ncbi:MAG TPA: pilus assembly protein CpaE, partial [Propionicimonas sp.]|nr:pilus assembly protein CpaE [Propionicimonas sp.]
MISHEQGRQLRLLVAWEPASGDRFVIPGTDLDEVFVIAEMTIEAQDVPGGQIIKFNGTTEWALDSIAAEK